MMIWTLWMVESRTSGSLVYLVDYRIFGLEWGSEDSKMGPEF